MLHIRLWFIAFIVWGLTFSPWSGAAEAWPPVSSLSADDAIALTWHVPLAQVQFAPRLAVPGYAQTSEPGLPQLPYTSTLVALPPGTVPTLQVLEEKVVPLPGEASLMLAPSPAGVLRDAAGRVLGGAFAPATVIQSASALPSLPSSVMLEQIGVVRGVRLARVTFYPVRHRAGQLVLTTLLRALIRFNTSDPSGPLTGRATSTDPLLASVRSAVVNPAQALPLAGELPAPSANAAAGAGNLFAAMEISQTGLAALTYKAVQSFLPPGADPHRLYLWHDGREIAAEWEGDDDTVFEPGERLLFYAEPRFSRWTNGDMYFLGQGAAPGLRMSSRSAVPTTRVVGDNWADVTAEVNALYTPDCFCAPIPPGRDGDRWAWVDLKRPGNPQATVSLDLPAVDVAHPATLTVWLIGYTDLAASPDHRVDVSLNGVPLGRAEWDGKRAVTATLAIPPGTLHEGSNQVTSSLPGLPGVAIEGAWLDAAAVRYSRSAQPAGSSALIGLPVSPSQPVTSSLPVRLYLPLVARDLASAGESHTVALSSPGPYRAYDVADLVRPQRLTDVGVTGSAVTWSDPLGGARRTLVTSEVGVIVPRVRRVESPWEFSAGGTITGADALIITHPDFAGALSPLVSLRQSQGLTATVVNVLGIYDEFGDGRPDPAAIRAFIANAYAAWQPRPAYVLLVGDGSFDPRLYRADSTPTFIPPYLADVDPWAGETAADNRYVTVDGDDDDLPDLLIGRLPVKTLAEAQAVVDKIVRYETSPQPGGWNRTVTFVADDDDPSAGSFADQSEIIASTYVTAPLAANRIYSGRTTTTTDATRQAALGALNAGGLIMQYTGHSSWQQWSLGRFLHLDDLPAVRNTGRWPIVLEMTCLTGAFQRPEPTLDESLVALRDHGAAAAWGATGLGISTGHHALADGFFRAALRDQVGTVGQAALVGKLALAADGQHLDLLDTFVLLGDPALRFNRAVVPWASRLYLPLVAR